MDKGTEFTYSNALSVQEFLESGGNLYAEMGGMFYKMTYSQYPNIAVMKQLFGVNTVMLFNNENPIDTLLGLQMHQLTECYLPDQIRNTTGILTN